MAAAHTVNKGAAVRADGSSAVGTSAGDGGAADRRNAKGCVVADSADVGGTGEDSQGGILGGGKGASNELHE